MTRDQVKEILDRILTWPAERQADVAHMVEMMEVSRSRQFDVREIEIIDGLPDWSSRTSVETAGTGSGKPRRSPW
jgi:hypothetical protein